MATKSRRVNVPITTATQLDSAETDNMIGHSIIIRPPASGTVDIGGNDVAAGAGWSLTAGDAPFTADLITGEHVWAVSTSGTVVVQVFEQGL